MYSIKKYFLFENFKKWPSSGYVLFFALYSKSNQNYVLFTFGHNWFFWLNRFFFGHNWDFFGHWQTQKNFYFLVFKN